MCKKFMPLETFKNINANNYNYGNEILYRAFSLAQNILPPPGALADTDKRFSSAISIIGNAYSANPTRSAAKNTFSNNGIGNSFERIVETILSAYAPEYNAFYDKVYKLSGKRYDYKAGTNDKETLELVITCVTTLNDLLVKVMTKIAGGEVAENTISFCSKFVHFLCPHTAFIYDSISLDGGIGLFSSNGNTKDRHIHINTPPFCVNKTIRGIFSKEYNERSGVSKLTNSWPSLDPAIFQHFLRAYALAKYLYDNGVTPIEQIKYPRDPNSDYMPRLVDSIFMNISK